MVLLNVARRFTPDVDRIRDDLERFPLLGLSLEDILAEYDQHCEMCGHLLDHYEWVREDDELAACLCCECAETIG